MKTINDFKIVNGVAILEGVAYAEEAMVVEEFLKKNIQIGNVSVISKDGRFFYLKNGKLVLSNDQTFINPYFIKEYKAINQEIEESTIVISDNIQNNSVSNVHQIEHKLKIQNEKIDKLYSLVKELSDLLISFLK